jgi:chromosome segregation ATPase
MDCVDLDDGGSRRCLGCRQFVHGNLTETPPGECPTPYKSPKQLLDEALAREAALREELAELREELSEEFDDEERKTETLQEAIAWIKKDRADYKSQWLSASESLKLQGITIRVGADREAALRVQLNDAATSLETISKQAGRDEYMKYMSQVCGYAESRASVARKYLDRTTQEVASHE